MKSFQFAIVALFLNLVVSQQALAESKKVCLDAPYLGVLAVMNELSPGETMTSQR